MLCTRLTRDPSYRLDGLSPYPMPLALLDAIRKQLDPNNLLNPGALS